MQPEVYVQDEVTFTKLAVSGEQQCKNTSVQGVKERNLSATALQCCFCMITIMEYTIIDGYRLFRKDRPTRRGGGVALYVREQLECIELCLGANEE